MRSAGVLPNGSTSVSWITAESDLKTCHGSWAMSTYLSTPLGDVKFSVETFDPRFVNQGLYSRVCQ